MKRMDWFQVGRDLFKWGEGLVLAGFRVGRTGFGWFRVGRTGFGSFRFLVTTRRTLLITAYRLYMEYKTMTKPNQSTLYWRLKLIMTHNFTK